MSGLLIVGGGYAGLAIAAEARAQGYAEPIRMATAEPHPPYHRPPLSKAFLKGQVADAELPLRGERFYAERGIELLLNTAVQRIELPGTAHTATGRLRFDQLAIATGTRARALPVPGADLPGVVSLRSLQDAAALRGRLAAASLVVVIGGGFIGLEVAAVLAKMGRTVTVLEAAPRLLARVAMPRFSNFLAGEHARGGVRIVCSALVAAIEGRARAEAVRTADGTRYPADLVLVAVGAVPNVELLAGTGLAGPDGVEVDAAGRSAAPHIFAAGDVARHPNDYAEETLRLESVQHATDQGRAAGAAIAGAQRPPLGVPWFWSDQYDLKLQMAGLARGATEEVLRGEPETRRFSAFYLRQGRLVGIDSVNAPGEHMLGRRILARRPMVSAAELADPAFDLRALAA